MRFNRLAVLVSIVLILSLTGCASTPDQGTPGDPWESYNRGMFKFNDTLDKAVMVPVAKGYRFIMPQPVNNGVSNFFDNIEDLPSALNNLLQFKLDKVGSDLSRFGINTTIGILGFMDVATNMGFRETKEDFGQTLGYWGMGTGPYVVLPLFGPRNVRDTAGLVVDWYTDPIYWALRNNKHWAWGLRVLKFIDASEGLLSAGNILEAAALDPYAFQRDAYMQYRLNEVYDGNPPDIYEDDLFLDDPIPEDSDTPKPEDSK
ncbi:MAG: VacJ family lipoprotein [gamma proteobacterium symbiont of Bathyaustriella thionipta]|nr:VacJ family lipoprotein [gamma proteobacterium symbiont of Bathyaustriella thionipta]